MVDVVFLLIIFFMLTTTFITVESGLPVDLPEAQTSVASPSNLPTVTINGLGAVFFGGAQVAATELAGLVRQSLAESGQRPVAVRADRAVPPGQAESVQGAVVFDQDGHVPHGRGVEARDTFREVVPSASPSPPEDRQPC